MTIPIPKSINLKDPKILKKFGKEMKRIAKFRCPNCGRKLKPDKEAVIFGTKKWDRHSYFACKCSGSGHKNYRISIG